MIINKFSYALSFVVSGLLLLAACTGEAQNGTNLSLDEFEKMMIKYPNAPVIDVRTSEEYAGGHIARALNFDINESGFSANIDRLDKNGPVLVYCLSGGRSHSAANYMRKIGFKEVYEMPAGYMQWRSAGKPTEGGGVKATVYGMSEYKAEISSQKTVLVDFYAEWCGPCKKMEPYLKELAKEKEGLVKIIRLDADKAPALTDQLGVQALPTLYLYSNGELTWKHVGYISKEDLVKQLP